MFYENQTANVHKHAKSITMIVLRLFGLVVQLQDLETRYRWSRS